MRADRVLSLLLLLQTRGKLTAEELAAELEVSVRTIYRDLDALSAAGVPLYADRGPGGGVALLDNYRTQLTGLRTDEVRALLLAGAPGPVADLGLAAEWKAAMLKLLAALPGERQGDEQWVRRRVLLDWERDDAGDAGDAGATPAALLHTIQQAVWQDRRIRLHYRRESGFYRREFKRLVDPYALVASLGVWHVVCADGSRLRVFGVDELLAVEALDEHFVRPPDFDPGAFWRRWRQEQRTGRGLFVVQVRVSPAMAAELPLHFGAAVHRQIAPDAGGWQSIQLRFDSFDEARTKLLALGAGVEVETPLALRLSILDYAQQVVQLYMRP